MKIGKKWPAETGVVGTLITHSQRDFFRESICSCERNSMEYKFQVDQITAFVSTDLVCENVDC